MHATNYLEQRLKIRHLRVIDALDRHKSLLRASRALNVTQPALTRTLQEIENVVGSELFERHARGVRANAVGAVLVETARAVLYQLRTAQETLDGLARKSACSLDVGVLPVAASGLLPAALSGLYRSAPELDVRLLQGKSDELLPRLTGGGLDVVVGRFYPPATPDGLDRRIMYSDPIAIIGRCDHPVFSGQQPSIDRLDRYRIVLPTLSTLVAKDVTEVIERLNLTTLHSIRSNSTSFVRELLLNSDALSIMPGMMMAGDIARGGLRAWVLETPEQARKGGLILRQGGAATPLALARLTQELERQLRRLANLGVVHVQASKRPVPRSSAAA